MSLADGVQIATAIALVFSAAFNYATWRGNQRLQKAQERSEAAAKEMIAGLLKWQTMLTELSEALREEASIRMVSVLLEEKAE